MHETHLFCAAKLHLFWHISSRWSPKSAMKWG